MLHSNIPRSTFLHFENLRHKVFSLDELYFCGAGCIDVEINNQVKEGFNQIFPKSRIAVYSDLEIIGHALKIKSPAVIAILGTGSNVGYWDGYSITQKSYSGGYLLGDEGSGFNLGKRLLINYLRKNFSPSAQQYLEYKIGKSYLELTSVIYNDPTPNKLIASYAALLQEFEDPLKDDILNDEFGLFIKNQILPLKKTTKVIHIFGSVSFFNIRYIKPLLEEVNLKIGMFARGPLDLLSNDKT